jgi:hypothetical protein
VGGAASANAWRENLQASANAWCASLQALRARAHALDSRADSLGFLSPEDRSARRTLLDNTQVMSEHGEVLANMCRSLSAGMSILFPRSS